MEAKIVVGLHFGDEGKGIVVDNLCKDASNSLIVRFSGGQQCGHTVWKDKDTTHVSASFGAGVLRGKPTYITEDCTMYLNSIGNEIQKLQDLGLSPLLYIHPNALVTTPFDVAFSRLRHHKNGHGSTGMGVGATMHRDLHSGFKLRVVDFFHMDVFNQKLGKILEYYNGRLDEIGVKTKEFLSEWTPEWEEFSDYLKSWKNYFTIKGYEQFLEGYDTLIFEGSQGILLDMEHGIFPNVTYAHTTSKNALELCDAMHLDRSAIQVYYVIRSYLTRHGNGWLPSTDEVTLQHDEHENNQEDEYQGEFQTLELDNSLTAYALKVDSIYAQADIVKNLVITCLDQRLDGDFKPREFVKSLDTKFAAVYTTESRITQGFEKLNVG